MHCEYNIKQPFWEGDVFGRLTPPPEEFIDMENEVWFAKPREQRIPLNDIIMEIEPSLMLDLESDSICPNEYDEYKTGPTLAELNETRSRSPLINPEMKRLHQAALQTVVKQNKESQNAHVLGKRPSQSVLEQQLRTQPVVSYGQEQFYLSQNKPIIQPVKHIAERAPLQAKSDHPYLSAALEGTKPQVARSYATQAVSPQVISPRLASNNVFPVVSRGKYCENLAGSCAVAAAAAASEEGTSTTQSQDVHQMQGSTPEQQHKEEHCEHFEISDDEDYDTEDEVDETDDYCPYERGTKNTGTKRKGRRSESEDFMPNPAKLFNIIRELDRLNKIIKDLKPINEMPQHSRGKSRKEKNKLASRACRLKKKKQHESNKVKLHGLECEQENLTCIVKDMKNEIVNWTNVDPKPSTQTLNVKIKEMERKALFQPVAGHTQEFVRKVLKEVAKGNKSGGLKLPPPT